MNKEFIAAKEEILPKPKFFMIERTVEIENLLDLNIIVASC